jgi:hypothetical protein
MTSLMVTWTDVFYAIGVFSLCVFGVFKILGFVKFFFFWTIFFILLVYQTLSIIKQTKDADKNGTLR